MDPYQGDADAGGISSGSPFNLRHPDFLFFVVSPRARFTKPANLSVNTAHDLKESYGRPRFRCNLRVCSTLCDPRSDLIGPDLCRHDKRAVTTGDSQAG